MKTSMSGVTQTGRTRVMIVDSEWHVGLQLADCLATGGYHAVLVRDLDSMLAELREIQPEAILFRPDSREEDGETLKGDTLRAVNTICPQASVLTLVPPLQDPSVTLSPPRDSSHMPATPFAQNRVQELLRTSLGIPCIRIQ